MSKVLRYAKFAEETEFNVDPAPDPEITVDIASSTIDVPTDTQAIWEGGIGRGPRQHRPAYYTTSGNVVVPVDVHTVGWFLKWALGGYVFTEDTPEAGVNLHEFYGGTDLELPPFTTWLGKDVWEQIVRGCMVSQLQLQVSDGYAQITLNLLGGKDSKGSLDDDVLGQLPDAPPITFPQMKFFVGGTGESDEESSKITDLTLTVNNNGDAAAARGLGSRYPQRRIPAGQRDTTVAFTSYYDSTDHIERVWGNTSGPSDDGSTELELHIEADDGDDGKLTIELPRTIFTGVQAQPSGRSRINMQVDATAMLDDVALEDDSDVETEIYVRVENDLDELEAVAA
ncbi:MAG: phage tail tube protein [Actinomycetota bacterium]